MTAGFGPLDLIRFGKAQEEVQERGQKLDVLTEGMRHEGYARLIEQILGTA
jgi:hypothetical protein